MLYRRKLLAVTSLEDARRGRAKAGERLVLAWAVAVVPNALVAFGVELDGAWLVLRIALAGVFTVALVLWLMAVWRAYRMPR